MPRVVPRQRGRRGPVDDRAGARIHQDQVGGLPELQRSALSGEAGDPGRRVRHPLGHPGPVQPTCGDHRLDHHGQGGLQAEHAGGGVHEGVLLVVPGVRRVVGAHGRDRAVGEGLPQGGHVLVRPQRRIHLVRRVVGPQLVGGQHEVVWRDLGGDVDATRLSPPQHVDGLGAGDVADVHPRTGERRELGVPGHDRRLRCRWPPRQPEPAGQLALVAAGVGAGQPWVLGVLGDDAVEGADVLQRPPHQPRVGDAVAVVGEHPDARRRAGHQPQLGQLAARQALAHRAHRDHLGRTVAPAERPQVLGGLGGVGHRVRVRHGQHRGEAPAGGRPGAGRDRLGVLPSRFAQVRVQVDQPGQGDQAVGVDALDIGVRLGRVGEHAVAEVEVARPGPDQIGSGDHQPAHAAPSRTRVNGISSAPPSSS